MSGYPMIDALNAAPTPRETADHIGEANEKVTADHAELARLMELVPGVDQGVVFSNHFPAETRFEAYGYSALLAHALWTQRSALLSEIAALRGRENELIATHAVAVMRIERQRDELRKVAETAANLFKLCTEPTMFENVSTLNVYAQMTEWLVRNRPLIANQGADQ